MRILVACPMKCGSTYACDVLSLYYGIADIKPFFFWGWQEHLLHAGILAGAPSDFLVQAHLRPSTPNMTYIEQNNLSVVCLWRNLADVVVSLVDHVRQESHAFPVYCIPDRNRFLAQSLPEQHAEVIRGAIPWYTSFYELWKTRLARIGGAWGSYEEMEKDATSFFVSLIRSITPVDAPDLPRLARVLESVDARLTRKNVGVSGRSIDLLCQDNKDLLLAVLSRLASPWKEDLAAQLPWNRAGEERS